MIKLKETEMKKMELSGKSKGAPMLPDSRISWSLFCHGGFPSMVAPENKYKNVIFNTDITEIKLHT